MKEGGEQPLASLIPGYYSFSGVGADGPPEVTVTLFHAGYPHCRNGGEHCGAAPVSHCLENCMGIILHLQAQVLEAHHNLLLRYSFFIKYLVAVLEISGE